MVTAALFVVPMMWLKRMLMVIAPATFDVVTGDSGSYHFTWVPIAVTLGAMAAIPLMLMLLFRVVPILSIDEIEEIDEEEEKQSAAAAAAFLRTQQEETAVEDRSDAGPERVGGRPRDAAGRGGRAAARCVLWAFRRRSRDARRGRRPRRHHASYHRPPGGPLRAAPVQLTAKLTDATGSPWPRPR